jgi:hypothetical protein
MKNSRVMEIADMLSVAEETAQAVFDLLEERRREARKAELFEITDYLNDKADGNYRDLIPWIPYGLIEAVIEDYRNRGDARANEISLEAAIPVVNDAIRNSGLCVGTLDSNEPYRELLLRLCVEDPVTKLVRCPVTRSAFEIRIPARDVPGRRTRRYPRSEAGSFSAGPGQESF